MDRYDFKFGVNVYGPDGHGRDKQVGHLEKMVVEPANWEVTNVIVESGFLFKRAAVIPLYKIENASDQAFRLLISKDEIKDYPKFKQTVVERGAQDWAQPISGSQKNLATSSGLLMPVPGLEVVRERVRLGVDDDALVLDKETVVNGLDGRLGHLSQLSTDVEVCQIKHLVVANHGILQAQQFLIPDHLIETLGEQYIEIAATSAEKFSHFFGFGWYPVSRIPLC